MSEWTRSAAAMALWCGPLRHGYPLLVWRTDKGNWFWGDTKVGAAGPFESKEAAMEAAEKGSLVTA